MKALIRIAALPALVVGFAFSCFSQTPVWRCGNSYTNDAKEAEAKKCVPVGGGDVVVLRQKKVTAKDIDRFQQEIKPGDNSSRGLVIEVKRPLVKVQTNRGEHWYRIDQVGPAPKNEVVK